MDNMSLSTIWNQAKPSVESENILAFSQDCDYSVRFIGVGVLSQKGLPPLLSQAEEKRCLCRSIIWWKPDRTQQCLFPWYNRRRPWCRDLLDWKRPLWSSGHRRCLLENLYRAGIRWILPIRMAWKPARHCDHTAIWKKRWYSCWNRLKCQTLIIIHQPFR